MSFNEGSDTVLYRGEHFHPALARNFDVAGPLEWIARITSHIFPLFRKRQFRMFQTKKTAVGCSSQEGSELKVQVSIHPVFDHRDTSVVTVERNQLPVSLG